MRKHISSHYHTFYDKYSCRSQIILQNHNNLRGYSTRIPSFSIGSGDSFRIVSLYDLRRHRHWFDQSLKLQNCHSCASTLTKSSWKSKCEYTSTSWVQVLWTKAHVQGYCHSWFLWIHRSGIWSMIWGSPLRSQTRSVLVYQSSSYSDQC